MDTFKVFESSTLDELEKQVNNRSTQIVEQQVNPDWWTTGQPRLLNNRSTQIGEQQVNPDCKQQVARRLGK